MPTAGYAGTSTWKVVHSRVIIRKTPSTTANILGFQAQGKVLEGSLQDVAGMPWLKVKHFGGDGKECDGYMLIDGAALGLGPLLERVDSHAGPAKPAKPATEPAAKPKSKSRPKPKPNVEELRKWTRHPKTAALRFEVVPNMVMVRNLPSTQADAVGVVKKGEVLEGQPREGWLLIDDKSSEALENGEGRWILLDGKDLGLGILLRPQVPAPIITKKYATSVQLSFDSDMSKYYLEVEPEIGECFRTPCSQGKAADTPLASF